MLVPESRRKKTITHKEIEDIVAKIARMPAKTISMDDAEQLKNLEKNLKLVVFGQDKAIDALATAIKMARAGLREEEKPIGNYLFTGPTGVGKTEVAQQLAILMGMELVRFDMSEYMEKHAVSRLIGAPPGYVGFDQGGLMTDAVDKNPYCVILLDEIEKAHPDVYNILLQIMDYGRLTDNNGKEVNFRNAILIMTSNAGASDAARAPVGFLKIDRAGEDREAITKTFTPEFRNRLDAIISFDHLTPEVVAHVVNKFIFPIQLDEASRKWLIERGYDRANGARPMARLIAEKIKKPLADEVLFGKLAKGGTVKVTVENGELAFAITKAAPGTGKQAASETDEELVN
jgi:ATP-dependent Clp protease ATP-binding subunit ClpA